MKRRSFLAVMVVFGTPAVARGTGMQQMLLAGGGVPAAWSAITGMSAASCDQGRAGSSNSAAAVNCGTTSPYVNVFLTATQQWNGSAWSSSGATTVAHSESAGAGTLTDEFVTSGVSAAGPTSTQVTDKYNGTSWSSGGNVPAVQRRVGGTGCGSPSAGLIFGGTNNAGTITAATNSYNGTTWSAGGNLPSNTTYASGAGGVSDALSAMGSTTASNTSGGTTASNKYNGTSWASDATATTAQLRVGGCGSSSTSVLMAGGYNAIKTAQTYDGTAFSNAASMNTGRVAPAVAGIGTSAIAAGGNSSSGNLSSAEKYQ